MHPSGGVVHGDRTVGRHGLDDAGRPSFDTALAQKPPCATPVIR
jgi:hypothetical protein